MELRGTIGFKGARGFSAYEIAVQNGFKGTEAEWLATLGASSHFDKWNVTINVHESTNTFDLPEKYTTDEQSYLEIYVNGLKISQSEITINTENRTFTLSSEVESGSKVQIDGFSNSSNTLPIEKEINETSTDDTIPSSKATYDFVKSNSQIFTEYDEVIE